jgi:hypothetical protein
LVNTSIPEPAATDSMVSMWVTTAAKPSGAPAARTSSAREACATKASSLVIVGVAPTRVVVEVSATVVDYVMAVVAVVTAVIVGVGVVAVVVAADVPPQAATKRGGQRESGGGSSHCAPRRGRGQIPRAEITDSL